MSSPVLALLLIVLVSLARATSPLGDPSCACIASASSLPSITSAEHLAYDGTLDLNSYGILCGAHDAGRSTCNDTAPSWCAGVMPRPPICNPALYTRDWCDREWCYVEDPIACGQSTERLKYTHSLAFPTSSRYYSYATCADLDTYYKSDPYHRIAGRVLRVGIQSNSNANPAEGIFGQGSYGPQFRVPHQREGLHGPLWEFVRQAALEAGFTINITAPDADVTAKADDWTRSHGETNPSPYEHCAYATAIGHLDLCIGMHTVESWRREVTNWYIVQHNPLYLVVRTMPSSSFAWLLPFTPGAWIALMMGVIMASVLLTLQEKMSGVDPQDWDYESQQTNLMRQIETIVKVVGGKMHRRLKSQLEIRRLRRQSNSAPSNLGNDPGTNLGGNFGDNITGNVAFGGHIGGSPGGSNLGGDLGGNLDSMGKGVEVPYREESGTEARSNTATSDTAHYTAGDQQARASTASWPRHLGANVFGNVRAMYAFDVGYSQSRNAACTQLGIGMFFLIMVSTYTANLTTLLVEQSRTGTVSSWEEVRNLGLRVCGTRMGAKAARLTYPNHVWVADTDGLLGLNAGVDVLNFMASGACDVAVMDYEDLLMQQTKGRFCDLMKVEDAIVSHEAVGMPMTTVGATASLLSEYFGRQVSQGAWEDAKAANKHQANCEGQTTSEGEPTLDSWGSWAPRTLRHPFGWRDMAMLGLLPAGFASIGLLSSIVEWARLLIFPGETDQKGMLQLLGSKLFLAKNMWSPPQPDHVKV